MMTVPPENSAQLQETDILLASFPRSGNTWMRYLLSDVILQLSRFQTHTELPFSISEVIPDIYVDDVSKCPNHHLISTPRIIKTHQYFESAQKTQRSVYLFRDPTDALCSYYYYHLRDGDLDWEKLGLYAFLLYILPMYQQHLDSHLAAKRNQSEQMLFVSYERLSQYPFQTLKRVLQFCQIPVDERVCWRAIENHLFTKHQNRERQNPSEQYSLPFFRKGKIGGGRAELDAMAIALIQQEALQRYQQAQQWEREDLRRAAGGRAAGGREGGEWLTLAEVLAEQEDLEKLVEFEEDSAAGEQWAGNARYGHAAVLKRYAGMPSNVALKGVVPQRIWWDEQEGERGGDSPYDSNHASRDNKTERLPIIPSELNAPLPALFYYHPSARPPIEKLLQQQGRHKRLIQIAAPFVCVAELLKDAATLERRGILFFPQHSPPEGATLLDWEVLADQLVELAATQPVSVCLYWRDIRLGRHVPLLQRGLRVVSAGHWQDPQFLLRLYHLLSQHQYAASQGGGSRIADSHTTDSHTTDSHLANSHIAYALFAGCAYFDLEFPVSKVAPEKTGVGGSNVVGYGAAPLWPVLRLPLVDQALPQTPTAAQQQWAADCLGVVALRSPQHLHQLFTDLEEIDQLSHERLEQTTAQLAELWEQLRRSQAKAYQQHREQSVLHSQLHDLHTQLQQREVDMQNKQTTLDDLRISLERAQQQERELQQQWQQAEAQIQELQQQRQQAEVRVEELRHELERSQSRILAMESSKFWQLRKQWFALKRRLGLTTEMD